MGTRNGIRRFSARPLWYRAGYAAVLAGAGLGLPALLLIAIALFGGRYQTARGGIEYDMWLAAAVYPLGIAASGAVTGIAVPWIRRGWQAALTGVVAALPCFLLLSLTSEPRGFDPYSLNWLLASIGALVLGAPAGFLIYRGDRAKPKRQRPKSRRRAI